MKVIKFHATSLFCTTSHAFCMQLKRKMIWAGHRSCMVRLCKDNHFIRKNDLSRRGEAADSNGTTAEVFFQVDAAWENGRSAVGILFYNLDSTFSGRRTEFVHSKSVLEAELMATKYDVETTLNYRREEHVNPKRFLGCH